MDAKNGRKLPAMPRRKPVPPSSRPPPTWDTIPHTFIATTVLAAAAYSWALRWIVSGTPILFYLLLLGESNGYRILPFVPLYAIFSTLNLVYAIFSTSWLLYWAFVTLCYPAILISCLFQFDCAASLARRTLRKFLHNLHFTRDKIAFFDLPALEIDTEVNGLLVIRGATLSLSTLTLTAHGVEVGIKLSNDMELAIQVDTVTVSLLRKIDIEDVYANIKGGDWEMTFGTLAPSTRDVDDDSIFVSDTPILRAASVALDGTLPEPVKMKAAMTGGDPPKDSISRKEVLDSVTSLSPDEETARKKYAEMLQHISETDTAEMAKKALHKSFHRLAYKHHQPASSMGATQENNSGLASSSNDDDIEPDHNNANDIRAAVCTYIHDQPSIPHPPSKSIRVSTIKKSSNPRVKKFLHRLPLLLRLLLSPLSYFHPITIKSFTVAGSGKWFRYLMQQYLFKHYATQDPEIRRLEARISAWLADANFAVEMGDIKSTAQVPVNVNYDIECHFKIADFMAYRTLPEALDLTQVVHIGGADATITLPPYLLPHHEHILPAKPTENDEKEMERIINEKEGSPQEVQARAALEQLRRDEANMKIQAHAHLPARFHQDLLNFIAALVKASKVIETDRDFEELKSLRELRRTGTNVSDSDASSITSSSTIPTSPNDDINPEKKSIKVFLKKVDSGFKDAGSVMRDGMRKAGLSTASAMANDRWIAKLVGKVVQKLERAQGDVGYSGNIPIELQPYRDVAEPESKILP